MKHLLTAINRGTLGEVARTPGFDEILKGVQAIKDPKAQETFSAHLEKIVNDLKTSPESWPFRNPVKKTDAPDYDQVIKFPMDLTQLMRRVKAHAYQSKAEFEADLNLIWDNCLHYNTKPDHFMRRLAHAMRKRSDYHLELLQERGEIPPPPVGVARTKIKAKTTLKDKEQQKEREREYERLEALRKSDPLIAEEASRPPLASAQGPVIPVGRIPISNAAEAVVATIPLDATTKDHPVTAIPPRTRHLMANFQETRGFPPASSTSTFGAPGTSSSLDIGPTHSFPRASRSRKRKRSLSELYEIAQAEALAEVQEKRQRLQTAGGVRSALVTTNGKQTPVEELQNGLLSDWWSCMDPRLTCAAMPELPPPIQELEDMYRRDPRPPGPDPPEKKPERPEPHMKGKGKASLKNAQKEGLRSAIMTNIDTLKVVRNYKDKLVRLANGEEGPPDIDMEDAPPYVFELEPGADSMYGAGPEDGMRDMSIDLLMHAGFEGCNKRALGVMAHAAAEYIKDIGRTMRFFLDMHSADMSSEEIILHTLFENGITEVNHLERYVRDDVQRYGGRLGEIARKLKSSFKDQRDGTFVIDEDDPEENWEAALQGIGDQLGEDLLGLGLDIPMPDKAALRRMMRGKRRGASPSAGQAGGPSEPVVPFPPPPPFIQITEDKIHKQIGILREFYTSKLVAPETSNGDDPSSGHQDAAGPSSLPPTASDAAGPMTDANQGDVKRIVPEDPGNASKTKIGPFCQILLNAPPPAPKKKKGKGAADAAVPTLPNRAPSASVAIAPAATITAIANPSLPPAGPALTDRMGFIPATILTAQQSVLPSRQPTTGHGPVLQEQQSGGGKEESPSGRGRGQGKSAVRGIATPGRGAVTSNRGTATPTRRTGTPGRAVAQGVSPHNRGTAANHRGSFSDNRGTPTGGRGTPNSSRGTAPGARGIAPGNRGFTTASRGAAPRPDSRGAAIQIPRGPPDSNSRPGTSDPDTNDSNDPTYASTIDVPDWVRPSS